MDSAQEIAGCLVVAGRDCPVLLEFGKEVLNQIPGCAVELSSIIKGLSQLEAPVTRYYLTSLDESLEPLAKRIRQYWHVENKIHYVRDVTQGEDASRHRTDMLPHAMATAQDFELNLYRQAGYSHMAKAERDCSFSFQKLLSLLNLK